MMDHPPAVRRDTGLLLVDIQEGFLGPNAKHWGDHRSTPDLEANVAALLAAFRASSCPIFHVCHHSLFTSSPLHPSKSTSGFMSCSAPKEGEPVFPKTVNSPFVETSLAATISSSGIRNLVICGFTTDHCVSSTVRMACNLKVVPNNYGTPSVEDKSGLENAIIVVEDATANFSTQLNGRDIDAETVHSVHLASLNNEFCKVSNTSWVLEHLLGGQSGE